MMFRELSSPSLKEMFVGELEGLILSGQLEVGEQLPTERELSEKMKVSRAVVSGGIADLADKGFLEVRPRHGTYVADYRRTGRLGILNSILAYNKGKFDPQMLQSIFEVRTLNERAFASMSAERRTEQDIANLRACLQAFEAEGDGRAKGEKYFLFYHALALASGNIVFPLSMQAYRDIYIALFEALHRRSKGEMNHALLHTLVDHVERGQPAEAADCASEIIRQSRLLVEKYFTPGQRFGE